MAHCPESLIGGTIHVFGGIVGHTTPSTNQNDSYAMPPHAITTVATGPTLPPAFLTSGQAQTPVWRLITPPIGRLAFPGSSLGFSRLYGGRHFEILPGARAGICRTN